MSAATPLGRLREALLPNTDVRSALLCTYGLDPRFFEAEVLPALLPSRMTSDAGSGSLSGYLFEADEATAQTPVDVFYDHILGEGMQLKLAYQQVDLGNRAFHPKLIVAEYDDRLRVIVGSANLTRPAWTSLFELFVVNDLIEGEPHGWTAGLTSFLAAITQRVGREGGAARRVLRRLGKVGDASTPTLHHSFDGRLFDRAFPAASAQRVDVISPFFEGEEGAGLFDALEERYPQAAYRLFLGASKSELGYVVAGPPAKLTALRAGGADLQLVQPLWEDVDDERAPEQRGLHGKLLSVAAGGRHHVTVGSANATRAALMMSVANGGNAELIVTSSLTTAALKQLLPPSLTAPDDVIFEAVDPSGEDEPPGADASRWVTSAWCSAAALELRLTLDPDAPSLAVRYASSPLGNTSGREWKVPLLLTADTFVTVDAGNGPAIVPIIVLDPEALAPRGAPSDLDLDALVDLLAGHRQLIHAPGDGLAGAHDHTINGDGGAAVFGRGAIPWRRILAGLRGLRDDLSAQLESPEATAWTLKNPMRFAGLIERFGAAHTAGRFLDGDLAFALHESLKTLDEVRAVATGPQYTEALALVEAARTDVQGRLSGLLRSADPAVRDQMQILTRQEAAR